MAGLLKEAMRRLESLPQAEQDSIASQIMETLDDEVAWSERFQNMPVRLLQLSSDAIEEHRRGETRRFFKKLDHRNGIYSARVGIGYRVLGRFEGEDIVWFWIGSHGDYDHFL